MILTDKNFWDHEAVAEVLSYRGGPKQAWDNTDIAGPWLNGMRNALNAQVFGFGHPNFFIVSATHGLAHLALLDQSMWDKYQLTKLAGDKFPTNTLLVEQRRRLRRRQGFPESRRRLFRAITCPFRRCSGAAWSSSACHNTMWEVSEKLIKAGVNPDKLSPTPMAAELTNHIIPERF